ncbi:hypothetical protein D3C71_833900 [compost metagenome]
MRKPSEQFRAAVLSSLERLVATGKKFTRAEVVSGALLPNGEQVGRSTLYRKDKFGNFVHADLLRVLDDAIAPVPAVKAKAKAKSGEESERDALRSENIALIDQMVTLEKELLVLASQIRTGRGREKLLEMEKYVLARLLAEQESPPIYCRTIVLEFERRFAGKPEMTDASVLLDRWRESVG